MSTEHRAVISALKELSAEIKADRKDRVRHEKRISALEDLTASQQIELVKTESSLAVVTRAGWAVILGVGALIFDLLHRFITTTVS